MKLIGSTTSPFVRKIRVLLLEKNIPFDLVKDSPWEPGNHVADFNPLGKVPAFVSDEGEVLFDSPVIAEFVDSLNQSPAFVPSEARAARQVRQAEALADGICDAGIAIFLEGRRPEDKQWPDWVARQTQKIERGCDALEAQLAGRDWLCSETMSLADISAAVALDWFDFRLPHLAWRKGRPQLAAMVDSLLARPSFVASVPVV